MSSTQHLKDVHRIAAGYKAALRNPNVSAEAKRNAMEKLREMGEDVDSFAVQTHPAARERQGSEVEESSHVLGGYKATLSNPNTSEKAKQHAEEVLQAAGIEERHPDHSEEQHMARVFGGYKAALRNPRVSEGAKDHAREYLKEHGIEA